VTLSPPALVLKQTPLVRKFCSILNPHPAKLTPQLMEEAEKVYLLSRRNEFQRHWFQRVWKFCWGQLKL